MTSAELSRRSVLKLVGGAGAAFVLGSFSMACTTPEDLADQPQEVFEPNLLLKIGSNGEVTVVVTRSDMGQGVRTAFAMLVAEELDADWTKVKVEQAHADAKFGGQGTGGSTSSRQLNGRLRRVGATARAMLVQAAAATWGVEASDCRTENGRVIHRDGRSLGYGELAAKAAALPVPTEEVPLKKRDEFRILGKPKTRLDNPDVVTGKAIFAQDVEVPGALYAVMAKAPAIGAKLEKVEDAAARKVPGVVDVVTITSGVAVVAQNMWAAMQGLDALELTWSTPPHQALSTETLKAQLLSEVGEHREMPAGRTVTFAMDFPFLAHATMEPQNAVADVREDSCTVWAPSQAPEGARSLAARICGLPPEKVRVNVTLLGGGFGRRFGADFVQDAVEISKAVKKPIKLQWSRADDMKNDSYRPMSHHALKANLDADGNPIGWSHQVIYAGGWGNGRWEGASIPYNIPNSGRMQKSARSPVPVGAWRSVEHSQISVADEIFVDVLAKAAGKDPYQFRKGLIRDPRLLAVLDLAAEKAGWGTSLPAGRARGIACFQGYGSYAAHVVEISIEDDQVKIHRVVCAVDCGLTINPLGVKAQMEGACSDGIATALKAQITIDEGAVAQSTFADYEWTTFRDMPKVETHILSGGDEVGGMGEVGYPGVPAAIANAVATLTGKRPTEFPIFL